MAQVLPAERDLRRVIGDGDSRARRRSRRAHRPRSRRALPRARPPAHLRRALGRLPQPGPHRHLRDLLEPRGDAGRLGLRARGRRTGSSRATASRRSGSCAGCPPRRCSPGGAAIPRAGGTPPTTTSRRSACRSGPTCRTRPGLAWGKRLRGEKACAIAYFGDGATSEGAFHEGANFAAVMRAPLVLFCNNNGWAISTPVEAQTRAETLADKAVGYGMPGLRVDGLRRPRRLRGDARGGRARARRRRADLHRGGDLPRRAARDRRRPEGLHRPRARRGGDARTSASAATRAICGGPGS